MVKLGRNDLCHCESGKKYKKCCMQKDEKEEQRKRRLAERVRKFSRKDLVGGPFKDCPKCDNKTFGVFLGTGGDSYGRECTSCWHSEGYKLPPIKKKLIYLDQFMISNMTKALDPEARSHAKVMEQPFWLEAYKRLDTLSKLNLIVCPDSSFHTDESLLSGDPSYDMLKRVYEHLSHGCTFYDHKTINRFQVQEHFKNYLDGVPEKPFELEAEHVIHGRPHEWLGRLRVGVNMRPYPGQLEAIKEERQRMFEGLKKVFERWQTEKDRDFMAWVREEAYAFGEGTVKAHLKYLQKRAVLPQKYAEEYLAGKELEIKEEDLFPPPSSEVVEAMLRELRAHGITGEDAIKKILEYLKSQSIIDIPTIHISSLLFGALARKAAHGQKAPPNPGTVTDVNAIASLLPYCDAIFIDNGMAALLREHPLTTEVARYKARIFSPNTKDEFLAYLDQIRAEASPEHLALVEDSSGPAEPYLTLLVNQRKEDRGEVPDEADEE